MIKHPVRIFLLATVSAFCLLGCQPSPVYDVTNGEIGNSKNSIDQVQAKEYPRPAPVVTQTGAYVDTKRVSLSRAPSWLRQSITIRGNNLPFSFYVSEILENTGYYVHYDKGVSKKLLLSLDFTGTVQGALDELTSKANYSFDVDKKKKTLTWSAFEVKTFDVSFIPGQAQYQVGGSGGGGLSDSSSDSDTTDVSSGVDFSDDPQFTQLTATISLWTDVENTLKTLISEDGQVTVSQATTTLTVRDHPENIKIIDKYLKRLNHELSKQVRLQVKIIEVQLSQDYSKGIDWNMIWASSNLTASLVSPNFTNANLSTLASSNLGLLATGGDFNGSTALIQAIEQQGNVSIVTEPSVTTMNNQIAQILIQDQLNYVASISNTTGDFSSSSTSGVETGVVTTGLTLYLLPKVRNQDVYLQISSTISSLVALTKFDTITGNQSDSGTTTTAPTASTTPSFVQLPNVNERVINQRAVIPTGYTLILAGYKSLSSNTNDAKLFRNDPLGAKSAQTKNTEIIFLITPTILSMDETVEDEA